MVKRNINELRNPVAHLLFNVIYISCKFKADCQDTDIGVTDLFGYNCSNFYNDYLEECGRWDDADFSASAMCCTCKGIYYFY